MTIVQAAQCTMFLIAGFDINLSNPPFAITDWALQEQTA